jgi:hypothetical protein
MKPRPILIVGRTFFFLGVVIGLALCVIAIWNNVESTSYFFRGAAYAVFEGLRCPVMVAPTEKGIVPAVFDNPTDEEDVFITNCRSAEEDLPRGTSKIGSQCLHIKQREFSGWWMPVMWTCVFSSL